MRRMDALFEKEAFPGGDLQDHRPQFYAPNHRLPDPGEAGWQGWDEGDGGIPENERLPALVHVLPSQHPHPSPASRPSSSSVGCLLLSHGFGKSIDHVLDSHLMNEVRNRDTSPTKRKPPCRPVLDLPPPTAWWLLSDVDGMNWSLDAILGNLL